MFMQPVEESAILEAYQLEVENGQYKTENRVAHILFETRDGEDDAALQERIAAAREKLSTGVAFSDVAAEFSDDVGSAASGGDLGFSSGDAFPEAMEEAIKELATLRTENEKLSEELTTLNSQYDSMVVENTKLRVLCAETVEDHREDMDYEPCTTVSCCEWCERAKAILKGESK
jgi:hypothetical protein